jgi:hypothetical protein
MENKPKNPEIKRLVFSGALILALLRHRKLDVVLTPDSARDAWPEDMRLVHAVWDGGRIVCTLEAAAWPTSGDWLELLYRPAPPPIVRTLQLEQDDDRHAGEIWSDAKL